MVKFCIIGCGRIAQRHAEQIHQLGKLVAVCDVVEERAKKLAEKYGADHYTSVDGMLCAVGSVAGGAGARQADVVAVCSPNGLHAVHSIMALNKGFHVLCEKPMALTTEDCRNMIDAAEKAGRQLFIVKQNRFNPPVAAVKKLIDDGRLGRLYSLELSCFWNRDADYYAGSWKGTKDMDGGTLFTQFSHFIDLLYWIAGDIQEAQGYTGNFAHRDIQIEDTGVISLVFCNGAIGTINYTVNSHGKNMEGSLTLFGEKGTIKIGGQYLNELEYQDIEGYRIDDLPPGNPANNYGFYQGSMSNHDKVYAHVVAAVSGQPAQGGANASGFEGFKTVEIINKIYSSVRKL
ncbi:MAG: Gfo/Idh/MocA family oxidoreductase [Bacteroidetes bacterium]|nr:Gfo/Idh/MocA family oxidoreductase [Bacteroidota bacterium]